MSVLIDKDVHREAGWTRLVEIMNMTEDDWIDNVDKEVYYMGEAMFDEDEADEGVEEWEEEEDDGEGSGMEQHDLKEEQFGPLHYK